MRRKDIFIGVLFAIVVMIFMNYHFIDRLNNLSSSAASRRVYLLSYFYFSVVFTFVLSFIQYLFFTYSFRLLDRNYNKYLSVFLIFFGTISISYLFNILSPIFRDLILDIPKEDARKVFGRTASGMNVLISRYFLIAVLNFLFVYILRLSYLNQEIKMRNENLKLEKIKAEHNALIQQINPHFFFNSLNGLSYFISSNETKEALSYLNNLTTVFRQILKNNDKEIHKLSKEIDFIKSYIYMLEKRFEGKFFVDFDINKNYENYQLPCMALLPLIENIIKHNKISSNSIINVKIYTNNQKEIVVENNISLKLEDVESTGIGLSSLDAQYKLIVKKNIVISNIDNVFKVRLPLIF